MSEDGFKSDTDHDVFDVGVSISVLYVRGGLHWISVQQIDVRYKATRKKNETAVRNGIEQLHWNFYMF